MFCQFTVIYKFLEETFTLKKQADISVVLEYSTLLV